MRSDQRVYVIDANALWWYLKEPECLTPPAEAVFRLAETGNATLVVPAIVVAEVYYLSVKLRQPFTLSNLLAELDEARGVRVTDLGRAQLERLDLLPDVPEMHDRLIAAEGMALGAPIVTRDKEIAAAPQVQVIW